jgi:ribosomal protein S27AE
MNATCPRCGTVSLVSAQATRFTCKTCGLRFCHECQHWKLDRKQSYCVSCGAAFSVPPSAIPQRILAAVLYVPLLSAVFLAPFVRLQFWHIMLIVVLVPLVYTSIYLSLFYRHTNLALATRREAILLARRTLTLATVVYIVLTLGNPGALIVGVIVTVALVLVGLAVRRADVGVIQELQANRRTWEAILSMSGRDVLLMRFPDLRHRAKA